MSVISTTGPLQHAVVGRVTADGIRANALTLGWNLLNGKNLKEIKMISKEFSSNMIVIHLRIINHVISALILYSNY